MLSGIGLCLYGAPKEVGELFVVIGGVEAVKKQVGVLGEMERLESVGWCLDACAFILSLL